MDRYYVKPSNGGFSGYFGVYLRRKFWFDKKMIEFSVYALGKNKAKEFAKQEAEELNGQS